MFVFGYLQDTGAPLIAGAKLEDAFILLTREELFRADGSIGSGPARLYFHPGRSVEEFYASTANQPDIRIVQPPTDQHWGDRTVIVRDPWDVLLVFSNPVG